MGGDVAVQSTLGVGSVFSWSIEVPVAAAQADADNRADTADMQQPDATDGVLEAASWQGHVLVVDDVADHRQVAQRLLQAMGLQVSQASGGDAAIDWLQHQTGSRVDLVITDLQMPEGDGLALLQWCRQHRPGLAVVGLSGHVQPPGSFDASLRKPASPGQLGAVLQRLLPPPLDWAQLRTLADTGDGLGVDAWIARHRSQLGASPLARGVIALGDSLQLAALVRWLA